MVICLFFQLASGNFPFEEEAQKLGQERSKVSDFCIFSIFNNNKIKTSNVVETFVNQFDRLFMVVSDF